MPGKVRMSTVRRNLEEARNRAPHSCLLLQKALSSCMVKVPADVREWFARELERAAQSNGNPAPWGDLAMQEILLVAMFLVPARNAKFRSLWLNLLCRSKFRFMALYALSKKRRELIPHLPPSWLALRTRGVSYPDRLRHMVFTLLKQKERDCILMELITRDFDQNFEAALTELVTK